MPKVTCSAATARIIDVEAVKMVAEAMGIDREIVLRPTKARRRIGGHTYSLNIVTGEMIGPHRITFSTDRASLKEISATLWHELTHARQLTEYGALQYWRLYKMENRRGYQRNKFECEARAAAENHAIQLTKGKVQ